jgi:hypothetical protein
MTSEILALTIRASKLYATEILSLKWVKMLNLPGLVTVMSWGNAGEACHERDLMCPPARTAYNQPSQVRTRENTQRSAAVRLERDSVEFGHREVLDGFYDVFAVNMRDLPLYTRARFSPRFSRPSPTGLGSDSSGRALRRLVDSSR